MDFAGGALLATGGAVAVFGPGLLNGGGDRGSDKSYDDEDYEGRFSFTLWNDRALRKADLSSISDLCESDLLARLPAEVNTLITKASEEEKKCTDEKAKEQREAIVKQIEEDLEAGLSVARVKQKLQPRCFVLDFDDTGVRRPPGATKRIIAQFTDAISILLATVSPYDEVVVKITSPGGAVTEYGLASSQLLRLRKAGIATTVCVDTVAASGGYMMACVADKVVASPFAMLGSIGVVAGMPNVHKLLKKNDVEYLMFTAGKFKRTVTALTENTEEAKAKFQEQLEDIHTAFAGHVETNRGQLSAAEVATGEAWLACQAVEKGLVDDLMTSDEYLRSKMERYEVIEVKPKAAKKPGVFQSLMERGVSDAGDAFSRAAQGVLPAWQQHLGLGNGGGQVTSGSSSSGLHQARFEDVSSPR